MKRFLVFFLIAVICMFPVCAPAEEEGGFLSDIASLFTGFMKPRLYTVRYFVDGEEYFPAHEAEMELLNFYYMFGMMSAEEVETQIKLLNEKTDEEKRVHYERGEEIWNYDVPYKEGYVGAWDMQLPEKMGKTDYELHAVYTIGTYTITFKDSGNGGNSYSTGILAEITGIYGEAIDDKLIPALPDAPEGYAAVWDKEIPETIPGADMTVEVVYVPAEDFE